MINLVVLMVALDIGYVLGAAARHARDYYMQPKMQPKAPQRAVAKHLH